MGKSENGDNLVMDFVNFTKSLSGYLHSRYFLMNVFFALKGSKLFIIICYHCSLMLCRVAAVKSLPALTYSADFILLLVL